MVDTGEIWRATERKRIIEIIEELQNPYPKDIFLWDNKETSDLSRGRFNQHCYEIWENFRDRLLAEITGTTGGRKNG